MFPYVPAWLEGFDHAVLWILAPLAFVLLLSGLDDLAIDLAWIYARLKHRFTVALPSAWRRDLTPPRAIAILVPLWKEHDVIGRMLEHNLAAIRYPNYHIFAGAYPNDSLTQDAVRTVSDRFSNVHLTLCPHDGPTSKADCLNSIYQHLSLYEDQTGDHFDLIVTHDAEDLIHPEELRWVNFYASWYDFIQTPVLALATPPWAVTHGVYCDEFAEYHTRDMTVRSSFGCFIPGSGVGTAIRRTALEKLAQASSGFIFEPTALTEDYENGLRLFRLGCSQIFVPIMASQHGARDFVATREFFPASWRAALRQRTRWVTGIALQGWQCHGWRGSRGEIYWMWRDRKGLIGSPLGLFANAVFLYGLATALWNRTTALDAQITSATLYLQFLRLAVRMFCVARVYGWVFSLGVPVRALYANALNASAVTLAVTRFLRAKAHGQPLPWLKTDHSYPGRSVLLAHKRRLGEILVGSGALTEPALKRALAACPRNTRIGEFLITSGELDEDTVYETLSLQQGLPLAHLDADGLSPRIARALPKPVLKRWRVLPFQVAQGGLLLAGPDLPTPEMNTALREFTSLEIRFHLVTPTEYAKAAEALL